MAAESHWATRILLNNMIIFELTEHELPLLRQALKRYAQLQLTSSLRKDLTGEGIEYFKRFHYSNGLLTEGSKTLMLKYGECLKRNEREYTNLMERPTSYWDGRKICC